MPMANNRLPFNPPRVVRAFAKPPRSPCADAPKRVPVHVPLRPLMLAELLELEGRKR